MLRLRQCAGQFFQIHVTSHGACDENHQHIICKLNNSSSQAGFDAETFPPFDDDGFASGAVTSSRDLAGTVTRAASEMSGGVPPRSFTSTSALRLLQPLHPRDEDAGRLLSTACCCSSAGRVAPNGYSS